MTRTALVAAALTAMIFGLSAWGWLATPPGVEIAVHWDATGQADRFGGKMEAFAPMPAIALLVSALLAAAPHIDPRGRNLARSGPLLRVVWLGTLAVLTAAQAALTLTAVGVIAQDGDAAPRLIVLAVSVLFVVLGDALGKARPNWFVGFRTPWTLSSDKAWDVTHRWAGRGFVAAGLLGGAVVLIGPMDVGVGLFVALVLGVVAGGTLLSFLVWRTDPDRETYSETD